MDIRALPPLALAALLCVGFAVPAGAQGFDYRAPRGPALGRVSPAPSIHSNRTMGPAYAPRPVYRGPPRRVCTIRSVRERVGDRVIVRRVETCRERW